MAQVNADEMPTWLALLLCTVFGIFLAEATLAARETDEANCAPSLGLAYARLPSADIGSVQGDPEVATSESLLTACLLGFTVAEADFDLGLDYQYTRYEYTAVAGRDRDLHRLELPLRYLAHRDTWRLDGYLAPTVSTSSNVFKDLTGRGSSSDFHMSGRLQASARMGARSRWLAGLAYDRAFGEDRLYPIAGVEYRPTDKLSVRLAFPDSEVVFSLSDRHRMSLRLFPAGHRWHVVSDELDAEFDYRVEALRTRFTWSYRWRPAVTVDLSLGYEFAAEHRFTDDSGARIDAEVDDRLLFLIGIRLGEAPLPYTHGRHL